MSNLEIREFSQAITNFVDSSGLPEEVKRMALQDILIKQERRAEEELLMEIAVRDALEKKQKVNGLCLKVAAPIGRDACEALIRGDPLMLDGDAPPLVQELDFKMKSRLLRPRRVISYTREPYVFAPGNVRVTFDMEIGGAPPADFFSPTPLSALRRDHMILEVKYDAFLPSVIADALQLGEIRVSAFSKYAACREYE